MSASSQYYSVTARVGVPHRHEVEVTVPLVGPAGATGPAGAAGASAWGDISGKPSTFPPDTHTHTASAITDLKTSGNAAGLWDSVNDEQLVTTGDAELIIRKTTTAIGGAFNVSQLTADRDYNLPDASGTVALTTTVVDNASGLWDSVNNWQLVSVGDGELQITKVGTPSAYALIDPKQLTAARFLTLPNASGTIALTESADNVFRVVGSSDATKKVAFEVDGISAGTTRTLTVANRSGTVVVSDTSAGSGSDVVNNIVSLTQAEYNAIGSPDSTTLYLITDP